MGRKKMVQHLNVFLNKNQVGILTKKSNGAIHFRYNDDWVETGFPISRSLPLADRVFTGEKASFYFDNLLPDNKKILDAIAHKFSTSSTTQFDLLHAIGRECVGALSFFDEDEAPEFLEKMSVKMINNEMIAKKIQGLATENPLGMGEGEFRLSLAGAQEKMALLKRKGKWYEPKGQTPTSHILKKKMGTIAGGIDFGHSVDNEWVCLFLASQFGIKTCLADIEVFSGERVLSVERFDREWKNDFLYRIPQEDFCQTLGVSPTRKYEKDGGPSIEAMMKVLKESNNALEDRKMLFKTMMFNDLIYNTDGHAKNFSIFVLKVGFILTPMYDLLSAHFIRSQNQERYEKMRNNIFVNSKQAYKEIGIGDWEKEAKKCSLPAETFAEICEELSQGIHKLADFVREIPQDIDQEQVEFITEGIATRARALTL